MGINDRENERKGNKRERSKQARSRRAAAAGDASYSTADWTALIALVEALAREQGALRLGVTRDGGAYALGVYLGDDYATEYIKPAEDFSAAIDEIAQVWLSDGGEWYLSRKIEIRASGV